MRVGAFVPSWFKLLLAGLLLSSLGCGKEGSPSRKANTLRLATTTSVADSGLLSDILPKFEKGRDFQVEYIAVGTGQAIKLAESGEADVLVVHARKAEEAFIAKGGSAERRPFAFNDFIVVGPHEDPAGIRGMKSAAASLVQVLDRRQEFYSRGDKSGTHLREQELWKAAGVDPSRRKGYYEAGAGMGITLHIAYEKKAYTLVDRGTYLAYLAKQKIDLDILVEGDPALLNIYSVLCVTPTLRPGGQPVGARAFADWLLSPEGQKAISDFRPACQILFHPIAEMGSR